VLKSRSTRWSAGTAVLCLLLLVAAWFLVIVPLRGHRDQLIADRVTAQQASAALQVKLEQLRSEFTELPATRARLAEISKELPPAAEMPTLIRSLSAMADDTGVTLVSLTPGAAAGLGADGKQVSGAAGNAPLVALPISIVAKGDYLQNVAYLRRIQTGMPRAFLVQSLQITLADGVPGAVQMTLTGRVYALPGTAVPSAGPTKTSTKTSTKAVS